VIIEDVLSKWFDAYLKICPTWSNFQNSKRPFDHLALRTFAYYHTGPNLSLDKICSEFFSHTGYKVVDHYELRTKKVRAYYLECPNLPKIFISELLWQEFSPRVQDIVGRVLRASKRPDLSTFLFTGEVPWKGLVTKAEYETVKAETSYGAWLLAWGYVPNHFAIHYPMADAIKFCLDNNLEMNGKGLVQGSPDVGLEQCSTKADLIEHPDLGEIEGGFVEFVERWKNPSQPWAIYPGFVEQSASKIMESTGKT